MVENPGILCSIKHNAMNLHQWVNDYFPVSFHESSSLDRFRKVYVITLSAQHNQPNIVACKFTVSTSTENLSYHWSISHQGVAKVNATDQMTWKGNGVFYQRVSRRPIATFLIHPSWLLCWSQVMCGANDSENWLVKTDYHNYIWTKQQGIKFNAAGNEARVGVT
jgi:hypothetical protein